VIDNNAKAGFTYLVEVLNKQGKVVDSEVVKNLIPLEGINHALSVLLLGASQVTDWYIGVYENAYTPQPDDDAATFPGTAGEVTTYAGSTRVLFEPGAADTGVIDNSANKAEFTFNATKTIAGGFIASASGKGAASGVLLSAVRFSSPKSVENGFILRITAGLQITSA
jgi:hypothetical protein